MFHSKNEVMDQAYEKEFSRDLDKESGFNGLGDQASRDISTLLRDSVAALAAKGELRRAFSTWLIISIGFGLTNSWFGISASLITGISTVGPVVIVYGILIITFVLICIGVTLSELLLAIPSAGGQYVWLRVLAPKRYSSFLAYVCGLLAWTGALFTLALMALALSQEILGIWVMMHPSHVIQRWQIFIVYEIVNALIAMFNCYGRVLPYLATGVLYVLIFSYVAITVTVLACSRGNYQPASFVFTELNNQTGWSSSGIAFILGLINPAWSFSCLDLASHLAEETSKPRTDIPKAILCTVAIGFFTSFTYCIAMFFCIRNLDDILASPVGVPIFDIYHQALNSRAGAICLGMLIMLTACGCTISSHTWQTRLCWLFARDNGLPFSKYLALVDPKVGVPLNAHLFSSACVAILGLLYLASDVAFNSMVVGCITFLLLLYLVPTISLLYRGRNNIKHGPFWLGKVGLFCNIMTILWTIFAVVFFSFPFSLPAEGGNMNYVSAVFGVYIVLAMGYWFFPIEKYSCRAGFAGGRGDHEEVEFPDVCLGKKD